MGEKYLGTRSAWQEGRSVHHTVMAEVLAEPTPGFTVGGL